MWARGRRPFSCFLFEALRSAIFGRKKKRQCREGFIVHTTNMIRVGSLTNTYQEALLKTNRPSRQ